MFILYINILYDQILSNFELQTLRQEAINSASKKNLLQKNELPLEPGKYKTKWGEFILSQSLTSPTTSDVCGYSSRSNYLAIARKTGKS